MLIEINKLREDYVYNDQCEEAVAQLLGQLAGAPVTDTNTYGDARVEYDFRVGGMPIELKITRNSKLPVEVAKDRARNIPSGIATSTAPYILYLSNGLRAANVEAGEREGTKVPCAKLRLYKRSVLMNAVERGALRDPSWYPGESASQHALVYYVKDAFDLPHTWLGDMNQNVDNGQIVSYDTDTFKPGVWAQSWLKYLIDEYNETEDK